MISSRIREERNVPNIPICARMEERACALRRRRPAHLPVQCAELRMRS